MKLSEKGLGNVFYHQSLDLDIDSYEFKPEDFEDFECCVVLTLEEAKEISFQLYSLAMLYDTLILELDPDKSLIKRVGKSYEPLNKKISQARKAMRIKQAEERK